MTTTEYASAEQAAQASLDCIVEMVKALEDGELWEGIDPEQAIHEDPLEIYTEGDERYGEYHRTGYVILLSTGGPATRITGRLDQWDEPETAEIEGQDWGTPWVQIPTDRDEADALLTYARQFYFGS